ncbi:hypothetical protein EMCRGX_G000718 [Ephydatia muelleri]|eukprot:Em0001g548a
MTPLQVAAFLMLIVAAHCRTPVAGRQTFMDAEYIREYEEALISGKLNEQAQALRDRRETTAASTSVEIRLHSSRTQVDATILDKRLVITGYDQSGLPKVTNYVAYEQFYDSAEWTLQTRGIHVIVLDQSTGRVVSYKAFDTWGVSSSSAALVAHLKTIPAGRIVCFAIVDEGSMQLSAEAKSAIIALGSTKISSLEFRDMWTFVTVKGGNAIGEAIQKRVPSEDWARDLHLRVNVPLV